MKVLAPGRPHQAVAALLALAAAADAGAADPSAGEAKARPCMVCHGPLGIATQPETPNLAGQPASYLAAQLKAFRGGTRRHEVMSVIAKPLSDEDIAALAGWYASIRVEASR
ncbi:c-type cytochrome [Ideonella sp. YS5]|uniref:c-type cytochrome n=1 Tax=Ideonella sp. YS5 TaxID=3453714 RepID=UPI003EEA3219